jgi:hypothetical protein
MASDNFNRTENPLSTGWATASGFNAVQANGSVAVGTSGDCVSVRTGAHPADQFSEVTIGALNNDGGPVVRGSTSVVQGYFCDAQLTTPNEIQIFKITAGPTFTPITVIQTGVNIVNGDVIRVEVSGGATTVLVVKKNGVAETNVTGGSLTDTTSPYTSGVPGIFASGTSLTFDAWQGTDPATSGGILLH